MAFSDATALSRAELMQAHEHIQPFRCTLYVPAFAPAFLRLTEHGQSLTRHTDMYICGSATPQWLTVIFLPLSTIAACRMNAGFSTYVSLPERRRVNYLVQESTVMSMITWCSHTVCAGRLPRRTVEHSCAQSHHWHLKVIGEADASLPKQEGMVLSHFLRQTMGFWNDGS